MQRSITQTIIAIFLPYDNKSSRVSRVIVGLDESRTTLGEKDHNLSDLGVDKALRKW